MRYRNCFFFLAVVLTGCNVTLRAQVVALDASGLRTLSQMDPAMGGWDSKITFGSQAPSAEVTWLKGVAKAGNNFAYGADVQAAGQTSWAQTFSQTPNLAFSVIGNDTWAVPHLNKWTQQFVNITIGFTRNLAKWRESATDPVQSKYYTFPDIVLTTGTIPLGRSPEGASSWYYVFSAEMKRATNFSSLSTVHVDDAAIGQGHLSASTNFPLLGRLIKEWRNAGTTKFGKWIPGNSQSSDYSCVYGIYGGPTPKLGGKPDNLVGTSFALIQITTALKNAGPGGPDGYHGAPGKPDNSDTRKPAWTLFIERKNGWGPNKHSTNFGVQKNVSWPNSG